MSQNYQQQALDLIWKLPKETPLEFVQKFTEYVVNGEWELGARSLAINLCEDNDFKISGSCYKAFEMLLKDTPESDTLEVLKVKEGE